MNEKQMKLPVMKKISDTAKLLNLTEYHVRQLVLQNKVKYVKSGIKYYLNLDSVIEYLTNGEPKTFIKNNEVRKIERENSKHGR